jgi:glutathione S-transferase
MWFTHFHVEEDLSTAINRYAMETKRICTVIDNALCKQREKLGLGAQKPVWLVGDHYTYADLSFVPWNVILFGRLFPEGGNEWQDELPEFYKWHRNLVSLPEVRSVLDLRTECIRTMRDTADAVRARQSDARKP